ncbi:MAG: F0F1 ATP synthase subunit delta [Chloroflexota bacterium]
MARRASARRYAQAVFEIALETKELDRWQSDLGKIAGITGDAELVAFLESPKFNFDNKTGVLAERFKGMNPLALNLVLLLASKGRLGLAGGIAEDYQRRLDRHRGVESAEVITAVPLSDEDKRKLAEDIGDIFGKKVVLKSEVNPELIGGIVVRVGGKLLDGSTQGKLLALKKELASMERR